MLASDVLCLYGLGPAVAHCAFNILGTLISRSVSLEHMRSDIARFIPSGGSFTAVGQIDSWGA